MTRENFSKTQLDKGEERLCRSCAATKQKFECDKYAKLLCTECEKSLPRKDFSTKQLKQPTGAQRLCSSCTAGSSLLTCGHCHGVWPRSTYAKQQLQHGPQRKCADCKQCGKCQRYLASTLYQRCKAETPSYMKSVKKRRCDHCLNEFDAEVLSSYSKHFTAKSSHDV